jgi:hypothetical protein
MIGHERTALSCEAVAYENLEISAPDAYKAPQSNRRQEFVVDPSANRALVHLASLRHIHNGEEHLTIN